ncbi:MAG: LytTR family transcriptional regulator DNA-binding domain-containing protein [Firmicutes bacterium]|nr:LytTR family transcriptional regulator DNA-binding domain-containing protein [Bacillota bacterium]
MPFSVFLFDDSLRDVTDLAGLLDPESPLSGNSITAEAVRRELRTQDFFWYADFAEAQKAVRESTYQLFLLDIRLEGRSENGLELIPLIRQHHPYAEIWIWSSLRHMKEEVVRNLGSDAFFSKSDMPYLVERIHQAKNYSLQTPFTGIQINDAEGEEFIFFRDIIASQRIEETYSLYLFQENGASCRIREIGRRKNINRFLTALSPGVSACFLRISKNTVVNILMIEEARMDNKGYYLRMRQNAGSFEIGRSYLKNVFNCIGKQAFAKEEKSRDSL